MRCFITAVLAASAFTLTVPTALAQADAQQAYQAAKAAYEQGDFAAARDSAQAASQTDTDNPEVFLLLGKAHYQLGDLGEAMAAWKRTLQLAPDEPFARQMVDTLTRDSMETDAQIGLIEAMIADRLLPPALKLSERLLADEILSESQRARVMTLKADALIRSGNHVVAREVLKKLLTLHAEHVDEAQTTLLMGQAKLRAGGDTVADGLVLLKKVVAEHADTPAAATARLELISFELTQGADADRADDLAEWLADSPAHPMVADALRSLLNAYLAVTLQGPKPTAASDLTPSDEKALALAAELYKRSVSVADAQQLTQQLLVHLESHYGQSAAADAAIQGVESLLAAPLPRSSRLLVLQAQARYKTTVAMRHLNQLAVAGKLPVVAQRGQLPNRLAAVIGVYDAIDGDYPAQPTWANRVALANQIRGYSARVLAAKDANGLKGPDAWALDVALPVLQANGDPSAVQAAVETIRGIIGDYANMPNAASRAAAVELSRELIGAVAPTHAAWSGVMSFHASTLDAHARYEFQDNIKVGRAEQNAQLSAIQQEFLTTLRDHVAREAGHAGAAIEQLTAHLQPWIQHQQWDVAVEAYESLAPGLPPEPRRLAELAVVRTWIQQVATKHGRLQAAGLTVPRELDETHRKALMRCYSLQSGLDYHSASLQSTRGGIDTIVSHYKRMKYDDVAEQAIRVAADEAVAIADEYADWQLAQLTDERARHELALRLREYGAVEQIALTPEFQTAIDGWTQFIADHPGSPLVPRAVENAFGIGQVFTRHQAHAVASGVYQQFAQFASEVTLLSQPLPGQLNVTQRARLAAATSLEAEAQAMLAKSQAERQPGDPTPSELSAEYAAAIAAYYDVIARHPDSSAVSQAISKVMSIAFEYAKIGGWDVADGVYANLLDQDLEIQNTQRLQFARGLCQLGWAMPEHAKQVLGALTEGGLRRSGDATGPVMLALDSEAQTWADGDEFSGVASGGLAGRADVSDMSQPMGEVAGRSSPARPRSDPMPADGAAAERDTRLLAMIRQQESNRAAQIAQLREQLAYAATTTRSAVPQQEGQQAAAVPVVSAAELARQQQAIDAAYAIFQAIRKDHPHTPTAAQARGEVLVMIGHWRGLTEWERSAALAVRFLADNPTDGELPKIRLEIARDRLAWAAKPPTGSRTKQQRLDEVAQRFDAARDELTRIVADFPKERSYQHQAQWDIATSYLKQARVVAAFSDVLARGQFVRSAKELTRVARAYPNHPQIGSIPQMLWSVANELEGRAFHDEAILVFNELILHAPMHDLSQQASLKVAQMYHHKLQRPLKAAEAYQELNFARGGNDQELQNAIYQIGANLKNEKRWVEALHVLETFVDSFPRHAQAGQALTMVGQIHQANEAWEDAIAAYQRVKTEFKNGQFVQEATWAIAECNINLSQWSEATTTYRDYVSAYPEDARIAEANRRIEVLKDLIRYQGLVDEQGQRKAFDAQYQIAEIVKARLSNPVKAIIEYRKVVKGWPESHLADDALYAVGTTYLSLGETALAREALLEVGAKHAASPLADDALFMVGKSYEDEADKLVSVTRATTVELANEVAQRRAYEQVQLGRKLQQEYRGSRIASLKAAGQDDSAELEEAATAANYGQFNTANVELFAQKAEQDVETLTATQLADREDKINAALRKAVEAYSSTSKVAGADKADEALLQMATIYDRRLKDSEAAMQTWLEIVRQFSGTAVAENASWRIAEYHEREQKYADAIDGYQSFLRNYRRSPKAADAQFAVAENYERLGQWVSAMDSYSNYVTNFPEGPLAQKARDQINWIKTYRL